MPRSKYETNVQPYIDRIESWAERGVSQNEIAEHLDVAKSTFCKYVAQGRAGQEPYVDLANALTRACAIPDDIVEGRFYKRCTGYRYEETTIEEKLDRDGNVHRLHKTTIREIPPDVEAAKWWLANRQPDRWKYRPDTQEAPPEDDDPENPSHGVVQIPSVMAAPPPPPLPQNIEEVSDGE